MICNKYELLEKIGQGAFSQIFKGRNIRTGEFIAMKIEPKTTSIKLLQNETRIYKYLNEIDNIRLRIPTMKWFGVDTANYYMVISLLGKSLESFKREQPAGQVSLSTVLNIGIQIIRLLESIHKAQLIHRDVKPDNFLFGIGDHKEDLYIIDFGFCTKYKKTVTKSSKTSNLIGTPKFASIAAHEFAELSRCDDLESVGYILIYLFMGELEWDQIVDNDTIKMMKMHIKSNTEIPRVFIDYLEKVKNMDYANLMSIFNI